MRRWIIGSAVFGLVVSSCWFGGPSPARAFAAPSADEIVAPVPSEDEGAELKPAPGPAGSPSLAPTDLGPTDAAPAETTPTPPAAIAPPVETAPAAEAAPAEPAIQTKQTELPGLTIETILPEHTQLGQPLVAVLKITNKGTANAELVTMALPIPPQAELLGTTPAPESNAQGILRFSLGELAVGQHKTIQLKLSPKVGGPIALKARLASITSAPIEVDVRQAKLEAQLQGGQQVAFGEPIDWKLVITNRGNGNAEKLTCTFHYPTDAIEIRAKEAVQSLGSLAAGQQREISLRVSGRRSGRHPIEIAIGGAHLTPVKASQTIDIGLPSVQLSATGPNSISLGKQAVYSIALKNPTDRPMDQVQVVASLPAGLKVVAIDRDAVLDDVKRQLYWQLPRLQASAKETLNLKVEAIQDGAQQMNVAVRAGAGPTTQSSHTAEVISRADLRMVIGRSEDNVQLGGVTEMTVVVQNSGSRDATNVEVRLDLPPGVAAQDGIDYSVDGEKVTFSPTVVRPSQKLVLKCKVTGTVAGDRVIRATLKAEGLPQLSAEDSIHFYEARNPSAAPRR